jgi:hypothetical protein
MVLKEMMTARGVKLALIAERKSDIPMIFTREIMLVGNLGVKIVAYRDVCYLKTRKTSKQESLI